LAGYDDFPLLERGPFGQGIQIRHETDPNFRPFLYVPRERFRRDRPLACIVWFVVLLGDSQINAWRS
jgi:hypothetical protein